MMPAFYDAIIIGGGITGAGLARDLSLRGLKALLLEKKAPGQGTTASSSHLIHGGLRYLLYDRLTTHVTCWDCGHIARIAAPLLTRLPILWPIYRGHSHGSATVGALLKEYDRFSAMKYGKPHGRLAARTVPRLAPGIAAEGLLGALCFDEWWVDPLALVEANLKSAQRHGAEMRTLAPVTGLLTKSSRITGVSVNGQDIRGRLVINASGPWIDEIASLAGIRIPLRLRKGTHLVYRERLSPVGLLLEAVDRGRYIFVIPSSQGTLVGPTDLPSDGSPNETKTDAQEIRYLLDSVKRYFPDFPENYASTIVGARPILGQSGDEKRLSREFEVFDHESRDGLAGFITIGGGKMSDFRLMAEAAADLACRKLGIAAPCRTHRETLEDRRINGSADHKLPPPLLKNFLRNRPRLREAHALAHLGWRYATSFLSPEPYFGSAEEFNTYYGESLTREP